MKKIKFIMAMLVSVPMIAISLVGFSEQARADTPSIYSQDGQYLGNLSNNRYDPESVNNPYGEYGNKYSADSINNPYGRYGSKYSNESANNPYATQAPIIYDGEQ
jgi:hypothetical protein